MFNEILLKVQLTVIAPSFTACLTKLSSISIFFVTSFNCIFVRSLRVFDFRFQHVWTLSQREFSSLWLLMSCKIDFSLNSHLLLHLASVRNTVAPFCDAHYIIVHYRFMAKLRKISLVISIQSSFSSLNESKIFPMKINTTY